MPTPWQKTLWRAWSVPRLTKGMLCLADRGFFGYELWNQAVATGADLLWRVKSTLKPGPLDRLPDGSYLGRLRRGTIKPIRVIKFTLTFKNGKCEHYRLITTILDYRRAPAAELARLYAKRWKIETMFDELKVRISGPKLLLRSATPDLVAQDVYGLLLAHFGVRHEMIGAAHEQGFDPEELSFVNALHVIIRRLPEMVSFSPRQRRRCLKHIRREIAEARVRVRPHRHYPRGVKHKASSYPIFNPLPTKSSRVQRTARTRVKLRPLTCHPVPRRRRGIPCLRSGDGVPGGDSATVLRRSRGSGGAE
jgi:hypothetical protein